MTVESGYTQEGGGNGCLWLAGAAIVIVLILGVMALGNSVAESVTATPDPMIVMQATQSARQDSMTQTAQAWEGFQAARLATGTAFQATSTASMEAYLRGVQETAQLQQTLAQGTLFAQGTQEAYRQETQAAIQRTQDAQETERAYEMLKAQWTVEAQGTAAAFMIEQTKTAYVPQATGTAAVISAQMTQMAAAAGIAEQALEREHITNEFMAWWRPLAPVAIGLVILVVMIGVGWWMFVEWSRTRIIKRDYRGAAPVIIQDGRVLLPDRSVGPVIDPQNLAEAPLDAQVQVTSQEQRVQAFRALPEDTARQQAKKFAGGQPAEQPGYALLQGANDPRMKDLPKDVKDYLDGEWKEAEND